jgi:hypothetical protein
MPIELRFDLTFEDYLNAQRLHAKKNWWLRLNYFAARFVVPVLGILLILLSLLIFSQGRPTHLAIFNFGLGIFLASYPWYFRAKIRRCYRRTRIGSADTWVEIGEDTIHVKGDNASSEASWKAVKSHLEDRKIFLLYLAPAKFIILPKRIFTPEQIAELQSLLARQFAQRIADPS